MSSVQHLSNHYEPDTSLLLQQRSTENRRLCFARDILSRFASVQFSQRTIPWSTAIAYTCVQSIKTDLLKPVLGSPSQSKSMSIEGTEPKTKYAIALPTLQHLLTQISVNHVPSTATKRHHCSSTIY